MKLAAKITKIVAKNSGLVDDQTADIISGVADAAEKQAEADRDATISDRLKMGGWCKLQVYRSIAMHTESIQQTHGINNYDSTADKCV